MKGHCYSHLPESTCWVFSQQENSRTSQWLTDLCIHRHGIMWRISTLLQYTMQIYPPDKWVVLTSLLSQCPRTSYLYYTVFGTGHSPDTNNEMKTSLSSFWVFVSDPGKVPCTLLNIPPLYFLFYSPPLVFSHPPYPLGREFLSPLSPNQYDLKASLSRV